MLYKAFISYSHAADGKLAPALQFALHRFARRWYALRAMRVFRDETNLAISPHLWGEIEKALGASEFFLLLASPQAAASKWVPKEVDFWLKNRSASKLLIIVTDGEVIWDAAAGDFDRKTTALPSNLAKAFPDEPLYLDFRWAKTTEDLSLNNPTFRDKIADIASRLHDRPKDELIGEDVREHRKVKRLTWSAVTALILLTLVSAGAAWFAFTQRNQAQEKQQEAEKAAYKEQRARKAEEEAKNFAEVKRMEAEKAAEAEKRAKEQAEDRRREAERQRQIAIEQRQVADCRRVAAQATTYLDTRLDLALLLGVESARLSSCTEGRSTLLTAVQHRPHLAGFLWGHADTVTNLAYMPDGRTLASSSWDRTVRFWDIAKRKQSGPVLRGMYGLSISRDGSLLASADGQSVTVWKLPGGTPSGELRFDQRYVMDLVAFSPDGKVLATSNDPTGVAPAQVFLWDVSTRQLLGPTISARIFAFGPDGKTLATDGEDGKSVVVRALPTRQPIRPPFEGHTARLRSIAFSADGAMLATGGEDYSVIVWDLKDQRPIGRPLIGHRAPVNALAFSPDAAMLASGSGDGSVIFWDMKNGQPIGLPLTIAKKPIFDVAFSPDGRTVVANSEERLVVWNVFDDLSPGRELKLESKPKHGLAYSPDGKTLASIDTYGGVTLSDAETGRKLSDSIGGKVTSMAFSPDGAQFATVGRDGRLALWDRATGAPKSAPEETHFRLWSVAFSPDGQTIAAGGDSVLLLWDVSARQWLAQVTGRQKDRIWSVAFSPDGKLLASGGNTSLGLWDSKTGSEMMALMTTADAEFKYLVQTQVAFSPDGKLLAYRQGGNGVGLLDVTHRHVTGRTLSAHKGEVTALAFSSDGKLMATGATDRTVMLWDMASRQPIGRSFDGMGEVESLAFRPNAGSLATLGDERLLVWEVNEASWRETACRLANRHLTPGEWQQYLGDEPYRKTCPNLS
jgi:WD40 repeat protein